LKPIGESVKSGEKSPGRRVMSGKEKTSKAVKLDVSKLLGFRIGGRTGSKIGGKTGSKVCPVLRVSV
jgi:hypothetical protein